LVQAPTSSTESMRAAATQSTFLWLATPFLQTFYQGRGDIPRGKA
jgi:hypothetical protein